MSTVYSDDSRNLITLENGDSSKSRNLSHVESRLKMNVIR